MRPYQAMNDLLKLGVVVAIVAIALAGFALTKSSEPAGSAVVFQSGARLTVEIAQTQDELELGLMYRTGLPADAGMLFVFEQSNIYPFWMKNTKIPLDMMWVDSNRTIVAVKENVPPCTADPCPVYDPGAAARYVIEANAGYAANHSIAAGQPVRLELVS